MRCTSFIVATIFTVVDTYHFGENLSRKHIDLLKDEQNGFAHASGFGMLLRKSMHCNHYSSSSVVSRNCNAASKKNTKMTFENDF